MAEGFWVFGFKMLEWPEFSRVLRSDRAGGTGQSLRRLGRVKSESFSGRRLSRSFLQKIQSVLLMSTTLFVTFLIFFPC